MEFEQHVQENLLSQLVIHDEFEARYWARVLGVSRAEVRAAFGVAQAPQAQADAGMAPGSERREAAGQRQQG